MVINHLLIGMILQVGTDWGFFLRTESEASRKKHSNISGSWSTRNYGWNSHKNGGVHSQNQKGLSFISKKKSRPNVWKKSPFTHLFFTLRPSSHHLLPMIPGGYLLPWTPTFGRRTWDETNAELSDHQELCLEGLAVEKIPSWNSVKNLGKKHQLEILYIYIHNTKTPVLFYFKWYFNLEFKKMPRFWVGGVFFQHNFNPPGGQFCDCWDVGHP